MKNDDRRYKIIRVNDLVLLDILLGQSKPYTSNLPKDMKILDKHFNSMLWLWEILVWSSKWEIVEEASTIPVFEVVFENLDMQRRKQ